MIIGYGFNRTEQALRDLGAERVYLDFPKTHRLDRGEMLNNGGIRAGDTLVMLAWSDLAHGAEAKPLRAKIKAMGVEIKVPDSPTRYNKPGRPAQFSPTPEQYEQIKTLYHGFTSMRHVLHRASEIVGHEVKRHQLVHRYGRRWD